MNKEVIDWRYLAGFFDGEGNVRYIEYPKTKTKGVVITIAQAKSNCAVIPLIKTFLEKNGLERVHLYITNYRDNRGYKRQPIYILKIQNKWDAQKFLEAIKNHLIVKRQDAIEVLEKIKTLKKHTRPFTEEEKEEIKRLYLSGVPQKEIAKRMGCGESKIWKILKEMSVSPSVGTEEWKEVIRRTRRKKFTDEEFLEFYRKGYSDSYIAKKLSVQVSSVRERRHYLGLPPNFTKTSKSA